MYSMPQKRAKKRSAKGSTFQEDDSALPLYIGVILLNACMRQNTPDYDTTSPSLTLMFHFII